MSERKASWSHELLILAAYLAMCALLDARGIDPVTPDTHTYVQPAENLLAGAGYAARAADGRLHPEFLRTPFYPLYLAACLGIFGSIGLVASVWLQRIAWGLIITFAFPRIGADAGRRGRALNALGKVLCLLSPQTLVNASLLMSDVLFACLVALALHLASRALRDGGGRRAATAGVLIGLATLTRPVGKLLPVALTSVAWLTVWWRTRSDGQTSLGLRWRLTKTAAVFLIAASILPLAWSARNEQLSGHFALSPLFGANLATHRRDLIARMAQDGADFGGSHENRYARLVADQPTALSALVSLEAESGLDEFAGDSVAGRVAIRTILSHPLSYARDSLFHMVNMVMAPADAQMLCQVLFGWDHAIATPLGAAVRERVWSALVLQGVVRCGALLLFLLLPAAVCLHLRRRGPWRLDDTVYLASAFYFVMVTSLMISTYGRFLLPAFPSLAHMLCRGRTNGTTPDGNAS